MPKINVYLPDELAEAVREAGIPVSPVCQRALEQAVRRVTAIRQVVLGELTAEDLDKRFPSFTNRAHDLLAAAIDRAGADASPTVGTGHLLASVLSDENSLAVTVLRAMEIDPAQAQRDLARDAGAEAGDPGSSPAQRFSRPAAGALELAVAESTSFGHNYIGSEHLLLGLAGEPDGSAGKVLRALGAEARLTRRTVAVALAGYAYHRQSVLPPAAGPLPTLAAALQEQLQPLIARIEQLEASAGR